MNRILWAVNFLFCSAMVFSVVDASETVGGSVDANRLTYLDERDPYYPHAGLARLTTPQWVGEEGVDAVILLSVDDMGGPPFQPRYDVSPDAFLEFLMPLVERLQAIDGRAPVAVMTCQSRPDDPTAARMLEIGMSLDCHTYTHRFPFLKFGDESPQRKATRCGSAVTTIWRAWRTCWRFPGIVLLHIVCRAATRRIRTLRGSIPRCFL